MTLHPTRKPGWVGLQPADQTVQDPGKRSLLQNRLVQLQGSRPMIRAIQFASTTITMAGCGKQQARALLYSGDMGLRGLRASGTKVQPTGPARAAQHGVWALAIGWNRFRPRCCVVESVWIKIRETCSKRRWLQSSDAGRVNWPFSVKTVANHYQRPMALTLRITDTSEKGHGDGQESTNFIVDDGEEEWGGGIQFNTLAALPKLCKSAAVNHYLSPSRPKSAEDRPWGKNGPEQYWKSSTAVCCHGNREVQLGPGYVLLLHLESNLEATSQLLFALPAPNIPVAARPSLLVCSVFPETRPQPTTPRSRLTPHYTNHLRPKAEPILSLDIDLGPKRQKPGSLLSAAMVRYQGGGSRMELIDQGCKPFKRSGPECRSRPSPAFTSRVTSITVIRDNQIAYFADHQEPIASSLMRPCRTALKGGQGHSSRREFPCMMPVPMHTLMANPMSLLRFLYRKMLGCLMWIRVQY
ncbi:hypothetical protein BDK51DRAFT_37343 [Blyttiomyces helicus]|uniref:Uncharacterized protein n=1 Tax=Blyttiomyces helicus TaxID=388810 RepID=A0A4P9W9Q1_9FUNG|nr:hypothetical protein BDK51DRAFT_37343 [Blyttiomyces helicus]|eukprot:RKO88912.1 hypothetical protein BDK51DRAFT_37343 [Blyttiomyces helicus]